MSVLASENRKVGGSTPPLATSSTAGQRVVARGPPPSQRAVANSLLTGRYEDLTKPADAITGIWTAAGRVRQIDRSRREVHGAGPLRVSEQQPTPRTRPARPPCRPTAVRERAIAGRERTTTAVTNVREVSLDVAAVTIAVDGASKAVVEQVVDARCARDGRSWTTGSVHSCGVCRVMSLPVCRGAARDRRRSRAGVGVREGGGRLDRADRPFARPGPRRRGPLSPPTSRC